MTLRWSKSSSFFQCTSRDRFSSICSPCAAVLPKPDGFPFSLDTNGGSETEVTVTSKLPANAERNKEIEKIQEREEKAASFGGAVRGSVPEDELSGEGVRHSEAESEGGRRPECPG